MYKVEGLCEQLDKQGVYVGSGSQSAALVRSSKQSDITKGTCINGFHGAWLHFWRARVSIVFSPAVYKYRLVSATSSDI